MRKSSNMINEQINTATVNERMNEARNAQLSSSGSYNEGRKTTKKFTTYF
jgi:hypothetical protein